MKLMTLLTRGAFLAALLINFCPGGSSTFAAALQRQPTLHLVQQTGALQVVPIPCPFATNKNIKFMWIFHQVI